MSFKQEKPLMIFGLPSKGSLADDSMKLLQQSHLKVKRPSSKNYIGHLKPLPQVQVLFQRATEIPSKLLDGSVHLGVTGRDILVESFAGEDIEVIIPDLGFGDATLVLAVPNAWVDIRDLHDLGTLAYNWRREGKRLRIATKFKNLTEQFLLERGIRHFEIVPSAGTTELDPNIGVSDMIADLTTTGSTLRENQLKILEGGSIYSSTACLVTRVANIETNEQARLLRRIVRTIEATLLGQDLYRVDAYCFETARETLSGVFSKMDAEQVRAYWHTVDSHASNPLLKFEVVCTESNLADVIKHLQHNGREVLVNKMQQRFTKEARAILLLQKLLEKRKDG
jgi:ATP phosphoribosyltransferase